MELAQYIIITRTFVFQVWLHNLFVFIHSPSYSLGTLSLHKGFPGILNNRNYASTIECFNVQLNQRSETWKTTLRTVNAVTIIKVKVQLMQFRNWESLKKFSAVLWLIELASNLGTGHFSQTRSSVPVANALMNSSTEEWFQSLIQ